MRKWFCGLLFLAFTLNAAELTGKWSGSFDISNAAGENKADSAYMELKQAGGQVTGTAGPNADKQWSIRNGKLEGQKLTFEVAIDDGGVITFDLVFDGSTIKGTANGKGADGESMSAKVNLKPVA
jgi:hypothetical protein